MASTNEGVEGWDEETGNLALRSTMRMTSKDGDTSR
jgi:hypothetical protein